MSAGRAVARVKTLLRFLRAEAGRFEEAEALRARLDDVSIASRVVIRPPERFDAGARSRIEEGVYINCGGDWRDAGHFRCGEGCFIGAFSVIYAAGGVTFGDGVGLGPHTLITSHRYSFRDGLDEHQEESLFQPVHLEDNVVVNMGATILSGVRIGRNSVVAARSVVTRDVPENCLVMGSPARIVKPITPGEVPA